MLQDQSDDLEKLQFYLNARFEMLEGVVFSNLVKRPSISEIKELAMTIGKHEMECLYNHFHMDAITDNISRQREYAVLL